MAEAAGPAPTFVLAGSAAAVSAVVAVLRARTLTPDHDRSAGAPMAVVPAAPATP